MGFSQYMKKKLDNVKAIPANIKANWTVFKGLNKKDKAKVVAGGLGGAVGLGEVGFFGGLGAMEYLSQTFEVFPIINENLAPTLLGLYGITKGAQIGLRNPKMGGVAFALPNIAWLTGAFKNPFDFVNPEDGHKDPTEIKVPTGMDITSLEAHLNEGDSLDLDTVKQLVDPTDGKFWKKEQIFNLDPKTVNKGNTEMSYFIDEGGMMHLNADIALKDGTVISIDGAKTTSLDPSESRDAFALINGYTNVHKTSEGKLVGDARVHYTPNFDLYNFSIERAIGAEDVKLLEDNVKGINIEGKAAKIKMSWDSENNEFNYQLIDVDTKATYDLSRAQIISAFNLVEDGDLAHNYFTDGALWKLETAVDIWTTAQDDLKNNWQKYYDIGVAAQQFNFSVDSDWANLSTPQVLADYLTTNFANETAEAKIDLENLTWKDGMGWMAFFNAQKSGEENKTAYHTWLLDKVSNDPTVADKYNWSEFEDVTKRDALIAKYAAIKGLNDTEVTAFADSNYLTWLRGVAAEKLPGADANWSSLDRAGIMDEFYTVTFGNGEDQGTSDSLDTLLTVLSLTDAEFADADARDGLVDGVATTKNLVDVRTEREAAKAYNQGYGDGLQNLRMQEFMNHTYAQDLNDLNPSARNDTITKWTGNADRFKSYGWDYVAMDSSINSSVMLDMLNDKNITNKTKDYIRHALDAGDYLLFLDTANKVVDGKEDKTNGSYMQRYNAKTRTVSTDGAIASDSDYKLIREHMGVK